MAAKICRFDVRPAFLTIMAVLFAGSLIPPASAETKAVSEVAEAVKDAPAVNHVPVTSILRSVPVSLSAIITASAGSTITSAVVLVRLTDVGTPVSIAMKGADDGAYNATIPVTLFEQVKVFWYAIDVRDSESRIGGTVWYRVIIIDPIDPGAGGSAAVATSSGWGKGGAAAVGVGLLVGGGIALEHHNDSGSSKSGNNSPSSSAPPPSNTGSGGGNTTTPPPNNPDPPPCTTTGIETASYENMTLYCDEVQSYDDILILVCNTCPTASVSATASWGASDIITQYSNTGCSQTAPKLRLEKPPANGFVNPGDYTISVFVNGNLIDSTPWPPLSDQDCL